MKAFNKNKAKKHIKMKLNKNTYIKTVSIVLACIILLVGIMLFAFAKFESNQNYTLINGKVKYAICNYEIGHEWTFSYTGDEQDFQIPCNGEYKIELWGAQGGTARGDYSGTDLIARGGYGSYTEGVISLKSKKNLYVYVGGSGSATQKGVIEDINGGYNGGGSTTGQACCTYGGRSYGTGGGATDVRLVDGTWNDFNSLKSRIMVAAGGGGGYAGPNDVNAANLGGNAGGLTGYDGTQSGNDIDHYYCFGQGAKQTEGGRITSNCRSASSASHNLLTGSFGQGGQDKVSTAAGGGGYYGGSRSNHIASAGGGSSFISGHNGCDAITSSSTSDNIVHTNQANHYSNYIFTSTKMIDGSGYAWTSAKGSLEQMPKPTSGYYSSGTGHTGNGYAKITLISSTDTFTQEACTNMINHKWNFDYNGTDGSDGSAQSFSVPCNGNYKIELWGAQGGTTKKWTVAGGKGGYTAGNISLTTKDDLYFYVGGQGNASPITTVGEVPGGYNGGGNTNGQAYGDGSTYGRSFGTGGGATDVRLVGGNWDNFDSLKSRIMVAGAGGGAFVHAPSASTQYTDVGGAAGGLNGSNGSASAYDGAYCYGESGNQTTGGKPTSNCTYASNYVSEGYISGFGKSATSVPGASTGGGSGYYGGGRSGHVASGGGGSSFISGYSGCNAITESSTENNIVHTNQPNHYSGKVFTSGVMIDGKGCNWSSGSAANCGTNQPQPSGSNAVGHSGNGYARIKLLSL